MISQTIHLIKLKYIRAKLKDLTRFKNITVLFVTLEEMFI